MSKKKGKITSIVFASFVLLDILIWRDVLVSFAGKEATLRFLDVGQGDSELLTTQGGTRILTDAGPDSAIIKSLESVLPENERYIDLALVSHGEKDHFGGFPDLLKRYRFGAFIIGGTEGNSAEWRVFKETLVAAKIPVIHVSAGDKIVIGNNELTFLSPPNGGDVGSSLNEAGLVTLLRTPAYRALFTADVGFPTEDVLTRTVDIKADILKVGHHGSKYSTGAEFLDKVGPSLAVIEVGDGNSYGHPSPETIARLSSRGGVKVLRTDENGTITVASADGRLLVYTERTVPKDK